MAHFSATDEAPIDKISRLAAEQATGELTANAALIQIRVYFFRGKIAWAANSQASNALLMHLVDTCNVDYDDLAKIVKDCSRTRRGFAETLVERGVPRSQVRDALKRQIRQVLETLTELSDPSVEFRPRDLSYTANLSFEFDEVSPTRSTLQALKSNVTETNR